MCSICGVIKSVSRIRWKSVEKISHSVLKNKLKYFSIKKIDSDVTKNWRNYLHNLIRTKLWMRPFDKSDSFNHHKSIISFFGISNKWKKPTANNESKEKFKEMKNIRRMYTCVITKIRTSFIWFTSHCIVIYIRISETKTRWVKNSVG